MARTATDVVTEDTRKRGPVGPRESVPLIRTQTPGVYRKGARYMVRYRVRGEERKRSVRTYAEARSLKAKLTTDVQSGEHRELQRVTFEHYAREWIDTYSGRTTQGLPRVDACRLPAHD